MTLSHLCGLNRCCFDQRDGPVLVFSNEHNAHPVDPDTFHAGACATCGRQEKHPVSTMRALLAWLGHLPRLRPVAALSARKLRSVCCGKAHRNWCWRRFAETSRRVSLGRDGRGEPWWVVAACNSCTR